MDYLTADAKFLDESDPAPAVDLPPFAPTATQKLLSERAQLGNLVAALDLALLELSKLNCRAHLGDVLAFNRYSNWQREISKIRTRANNEIMSTSMLVMPTPKGEKYGKIDI